jgi:hypothetical protein
LRVVSDLTVKGAECWPLLGNLVSIASSAARSKYLLAFRRGLNEEVLILAYGFSSDTITRLIDAGLATPVTETKKVPRGLMITVERIRITDDGRKALEA